MSKRPTKKDWMTFIALFDMWGPDQLENFLETWNNPDLDSRNVEIVVPPQTFAEPHRGITGFVIFRAVWAGMREVNTYLSQIEHAGVQVKLLPIWDNATLARDVTLYRQGQHEVEQEWQKTHVEKIIEWGATTKLEILPLVDWRTHRPELQTELGVAYLLRTDDRSILFDIGVNMRQQHPSPLLHNMTQLGVSLDDFDTIVISRNHSDHVGGSKWSLNDTFSLTAQQLELGKKTVYTPVPMTYPGLTPIHAKNPTIIGTGIATIGTIANQLFGEYIKLHTIGRTQEQAIAVNVEDKGIVLIIGCGHQTLPKILERTDTLFDEPLYGVVGGLHYAVDGGPIVLKGMSPHKYIGTGKTPWRPITRQELHHNITLLQSYEPKIVALSPHDSSTIGINMLKLAFPNSYQELMVGKSVIVSN
jgi:7,8-dihydropterin-6-yl-methyl-4-(beta-D-ribofuranosyl)aminobenzene 5'-phosphate synthase